MLRFSRSWFDELTRNGANLMPHMIGDLAPLVTQPMIDYLQGKEPAKT